MPSGRRAVVAAMVGLMAGGLATAGGRASARGPLCAPVLHGLPAVQHHGAPSAALEKHAKAAGVGEVKVVWATFNSPAAMNDALLSGSVDIVSGGVPGLLTIWARTQASANAVKGHHGVLLPADPAQHQ